LFADSPKAQQADPEFTLQAGCAVSLHLPFDGIADVSGNILKIGLAVFIARNAIAIILYAQEMLPSISPPGDGYVPRCGINAILDEFSHCLQRVLL
jgi:hypothetical protein